MKAVVFHGKERLAAEERPMPKIRHDEVLVQVMACGVCGTDVHIYEGAEGAAECHPPTILGHEFSGIISQIGDGVKRLKPGDRVTIDPNRLCGTCLFCLTGRGHFCENMVGYGTTTDGGFAEYCVVAESQAYQFAGHLSFEEAAMAEPVSCCLHGMDLSGISQGSTVLIIGAGPIGLIILQLARLAGAAKIIVSEPVESKRQAALSLGADEVIDPITQDVKTYLQPFGNIDTVIECAGRKETMAAAIDYAGKAATVMLFGLTEPEAAMEIKPFEIFKKELKITASFINPYTFARAVALLESGRINVKPLLVGSATLSRMPEIFECGETQKDGKLIIRPCAEIDA